MRLSKKTIENILDLQKKYPEVRSALIPALHIAQIQVGFLPLSIQAEVAELFDIDLNEVHAIVTFYDMFHEKPVGKKTIKVCKNISCMLRGSDDLFEKLCKRLEIKPGETTKDQSFTLLEVECLGACDRAPAVLLQNGVIGPVLESGVEALLHELNKPCGVHSDGEDCHG